MHWFMSYDTTLNTMTWHMNPALGPMSHQYTTIQGSQSLLPFASFLFVEEFEWTCWSECGFITLFKLWLLLLNMDISFSSLALFMDSACSQTECFCVKHLCPFLGYGLIVVPCNTRGRWRITQPGHHIPLGAVLQFKNAQVQVNLIFKDSSEQLNNCESPAQFLTVFPAISYL